MPDLFCLTQKGKERAILMSFAEGWQRQSDAGGSGMRSVKGKTEQKRLGLNQMGTGHF